MIGLNPLAVYKIAIDQSCEVGLQIAWDVTVMSIAQPRVVL